MSVILGISNTHNGSVALIHEGEVKVAVQAERISRKKRQALPLGEETELTNSCVRYCLDSSGFRYQDIDAVAFSTPYPAKEIKDTELSRYLGGQPSKNAKVFYVPHHMAHMEYIIHYGESKPGIVLVVDGSGSLEADRGTFNIKEECHSEIINHSHFAGKEVISAYWFDGLKSSLIYRFSPSLAPIDQCNSHAGRFLQSIGHYWVWASYYCFGSGQEAGKVMGLAAFGDAEEPDRLRNLFLTDEGELRLDFQSIHRRYRSPNVLGLDLSNSKHHQDLARKVQSETELAILKLLSILKEKFPTENLYLSGGVALNVVANERIRTSGLFDNLVLNGSVEDNGTAIGAALTASIELGCERKYSPITDYYGREYSQGEILEAVTQYDFSYEVISEEEMMSCAAELIRKEYVLGWFQGRGEFGPRALGNRSIFANPSSYASKYILDNFMKCRDRYRPYAPVVIEERAPQYFDIDNSSPVMMRNVRVLDERLVAITHIDGTARVQTVKKQDNLKLYQLLLEVERSTGFPILLNTSFNRPGEPIVETPIDALESFSIGTLDRLVLGNVLVSR